jgi:hypothetical protein
MNPVTGSSSKGNVNSTEKKKSKTPKQSRTNQAAVEQLQHLDTSQCPPLTELKIPHRREDR